MTNHTPVPRLDLAPKLERPLSLRKPQDYARLLYWVFFFPQALRWYVERFGKAEYQGQIGRQVVWQILRRDPIQRTLVLQALICLFLAAGGGAWALQIAGVPVGWFGVAVGVAGGVAVGVASSVAFGIAGGVVGGMAVGVAVGVAGGVAVGVVFSVAGGVAFGVAGGVAFGVLGGVAGGVAGSVAGGVVAVGMAVGVVGGVAFGVVGGVAGDVAGGVAVGVAGGVAVGLAGGRFPDWLWAWVLSCWDLGPGGGSRMVWLPLPGFQGQAEGWLKKDWATGVHNINQILAYTLQFISVVRAVNAALACLPGDLLLARTASLADKPFDWDLLRFGSASLKNQLWREATFGLPRSRYPTEPRLDTPARAACAGFWLWHEKETAQAADAFAVTRDLRHGPELHGIAQAIVEGQEAGDLSHLAAWEQATVWLQAFPDLELRPDTLATLRTLRTVAGEARVAHQSLAPLSRSAALGRASAALTRLIDTVEDTCPYPEWPLIQEIATKWRDVVSLAGGVVGDEVLRQPVPNPYEGYSGLPVTGHAFRGRDAIFRQIETFWSTGDQLPPIILYGHRRMGKSSILRNLAARAEPGTILVYLDMQDLTLADHTGQLLLDVAEAVQRAADRAGLDAGPAPVEDDYASLGAARRALNALLARLAPALQDGGRLILAVDEFELIEDGIREGRIDPGLLAYLRAVNQRHRWLALVFAGLHTLDELGRDYRSAFYGQAEHLRVGYLSYADAERLVTQPHPDFALEYSPALRQELYTLTYGQPYLLQRLCWELVNAWNERFLKRGASTPRELTLDDLAPVLTPDFYHGAGYYFDGVWSNVTGDERELMRLIASRPAHAWSPDELAAASNLPLESVHAALELLRRHDVILPDDIRFASELLRRWVEQQT